MSWPSAALMRAQHYSGRFPAVPVDLRRLADSYSKLIRTPINRKASCRASADGPKERGDEASGSEKVKLTMPSGRTYAAGI
jgi:hypothetical protein